MRKLLPLARPLPRALSAVQSAAQPKPAVEDTPDEFGLGLEDADAWTVYLRVPEITASEFGSLPLRALTSAFVEIDTGSGQNRLPLIDLRPGLGFAAARVEELVSAG